MSKQETLERRKREREHPADRIVGIFSEQYQAALKLMPPEMAADHARDAVQRHLAAMRPLQTSPSAPPSAPPGPLPGLLPPEEGGG